MEDFKFARPQTKDHTQAQEKAKFELYNDILSFQYPLAGSDLHQKPSKHHFNQ